MILKFLHCDYPIFNSFRNKSCKRDLWNKIEMTKQEQGIPQLWNNSFNNLGKCILYKKLSKRCGTKCFWYTTITLLVIEIWKKFFVLLKTTLRNNEIIHVSLPSLPTYLYSPIILCIKIQETVLAGSWQIQKKLLIWFCITSIRFFIKRL